MGFDHEIFSPVILVLPLFQEGQLPVFGERMCTGDCVAIAPHQITRSLV